MVRCANLKEDGCSAVDHEGQPLKDCDGRQETCPFFEKGKFFNQNQEITSGM